MIEVLMSRAEVDIVHVLCGSRGLLAGCHRALSERRISDLVLVRTGKAEEESSRRRFSLSYFLRLGRPTPVVIRRRKLPLM